MNKIEKYIDKQFSELIKDLQSYEDTRETELLHNIRVTIKKLKAIMILIGEYDDSFNTHKEYKPLRVIFRSAGDIREPEVLLKLLLKYGITSSESDLGLEKDFVSIDEFMDYIPMHVKTCERINKKMIDKIENVDHQSIRSSIDKLEATLKKSLATKIKFQSIHKLRKHIKRLLYLSSIHDDLGSKKVKFFEELQTLIGSIHDKQMLIVLIRKSPDEKHNKNLEDLHSGIDSEVNSIVDLCQKHYESDRIAVS